MTLNIDMSRPLRRHPELTALVDAIANAPRSEQETDYVEWKSTFDLRSTAKHRFSAAKHVLGFGNRHPDRVRAAFEGCAYLVLGAEPQSVPGVAGEDVSQVETWIGAYVGSDGPQWGLSYVAAQGKDVLVITIEAPRWGDEIFTLAKAYEGFHAGSVFTRRTGKTEPANPADMQMLQDRGRRRPVALEVVHDGSVPLTTYLASDTDRPQWVASEQTRLAEPFEHRPRSSSIVAPIIAQDHRTDSEYVTEVNDYLSRQAGNLWHALVLAGAVERELAPIRLKITNPTDRNFAAVQVVVELPQGAHGFFSPEGALELMGAPEPPDPWGTLFSPPAKVTALAGDQKMGSVRPVNGRFEVIFAPVDVWPRRPSQLPTLFLALPRAFTNDVVTISWTAASMSADSDVAGTVDLPVEPQPVPAAALVSAGWDATQ